MGQIVKDTNRRVPVDASVGDANASLQARETAVRINFLGASA